MSESSFIERMSERESEKMMNEKRRIEPETIKFIELM